MIIKYSDLPKLRKNWKNKKIVCGGGAFDVIHLGHIEFLKSLKSKGDMSVVLVNSNARIRERKGNLRPINPQIQRAKILDSIKYVDCVVLCPPGKLSTERCLLRLKPDIFFTVYSNRWRKQKSFFEENSIKFYCTPLKKKLNSSTRILNKLLQKN